MKKQKCELLIITSTQHMSCAELSGLTDKARLAMWLEEDSTAELKSSEWSGRFLPSAKQIDAMQTVIDLINAGAIALGDDQFSPGGRRFRMQKIGKSASESVQEAMTRVEATTAELREAVTPGLEPGQVMIDSFLIDPLESAIASTISLMNDHAVFLAESNLSDGQRAGLRFLGEKLNSHLNHLLAAQLKRVTEHE